MKDLKIPKVCEFNFKLLLNIVPCGKIICKWRKDVSNACERCSEIETTRHMLYEWPHMLEIWNPVSTVINVNLIWKHIICGFPKFEVTNQITCINDIISTLAYAIFKENSSCKFNKRNYRKLT